MEHEFVFDLFSGTDTKSSGRIVLSGLKDGIRTDYTMAEYYRNVVAVADFLSRSGIRKGECVLNISENCPEWNFTDMGTMITGGIHVPVSPSLSDKEMIHVFAQTKPRFVFISGKFIFRRIQELKPELPVFEHIICFNLIKDIPYYYNIIQSDHTGECNFIEKMRAALHPDDMATIIYTSGSTGLPKGVMQTHRNIISGLINTERYFDLTPGSTVMSYLPLSHSFERWMNYVYQFSGIKISYADYGTSIIGNMSVIQPDAVATVPLFLEKIYEQVTHSGTPSFDREAIYRLLGNKLKMLFTAGAALSKKLFDYFETLEIPVYEIYGSSETMVNSFNYKGNVKQGTVGKVKPSCLIMFSEEKEILLKGDHIMKGYYLLTAQTKEAIDEEGWYHSGDIGEIDQDGFVTIKGRKTDLFKTTSGAFVSPVTIENLITKSPFVRFALIFGENQSKLGVIIIPDFDYIKTHLNEPAGAMHDLIHHPEVLSQIKDHIDDYNINAVETEIIVHTILSPDEWTLEGGELTSSQKLKRRYLLGKYKDLILKQYK